MKRIKLVAPLGAGGPPQYMPPPINPAGVQLQTQELAPGVFALLSTKPPVDNSGFVVGERGVLVIDGHINAAMAAQIQAAVREVTDKPILFLANTNYHGDHTFGNYAFPRETLIVGHYETAERMRDLEGEKEFLLSCVGNDRRVFADVRLRLPDIVFDGALRLDLGGRSVELHHFGPANTPGDTVVYVPDVRTAWGGNLFSGGFSLPLLLEFGAPDYLATLARFQQALEVATLVPGHGPLTTGEAFSRNISYLSDLVESVRGAIRAGKGLQETLTESTLDEKYLPAPDSPLAARRPSLAGTHLWNVQHTFKALSSR